MPVHISVRLAWHDYGWNGCICQKPRHNVYCVGPYSFPGDIIAEGRDLDWEERHTGEPCTSKRNIPPCCFSVNAFGQHEIWAENAEETAETAETAAENCSRTAAETLVSGVSEDHVTVDLDA